MYILNKTLSFYVGTKLYLASTQRDVICKQFTVGMPQIVANAVVTYEIHHDH